MSERWSRQEALAEALTRGEAPPADLGLDAEEVADVAAALGALRAATAMDEPAAFAPLAGQRIGDYELLEPVGRGAFGTVYRARDLHLNVEVALKLVAAPPGVEAEVQERFEREARAVARLDHPHVVRVRAAGWDPRGPFLVMDFVAGRSLQRRLEEGPLPAAEAVTLARQLCRALAHAHAAGVLHRDVKPDNVLLGADGRARLSDFGLARDALAPAGSAVSQAGHGLGTPGYWPPEQARGDLDAIGPASDVYGVGATLYAALTGRPPYTGAHTLAILEAMARREPIPPPSRLNPAVDRGLDAICARCLAIGPADRYPSAEALDAALGAWEAGDRRLATHGGWVLAASAAAMLATIATWSLAIGGLGVEEGVARAPSPGWAPATSSPAATPSRAASASSPAAGPTSRTSPGAAPTPGASASPSSSAGGVADEEADDWGESALESAEGDPEDASSLAALEAPAEPPPVQASAARWRRRAVLTPDVRQDALVVSDPVGQRVLLFGGQLRKGYSDQLWAWDGARWQLQATPAAPPGRAGAAGVVDGRGRLLVFGGKDDGGWLDDAWAWDGQGWTPLSPPEGYAGRTLDAAWDPKTERVLLLGERKLWAFEGETWRDLAPPPVFGRALGWIARRQALLLLGQDGRLWELDGATWGGATAPLVGPVRQARVVDAGERGVLAFVAQRPTRREVRWETWRYADGGWVRLETGQPGGSLSAGVGWLPGRQQAVSLVGGRKRGDPGETWVLELR